MKFSFEETAHYKYTCDVFHLQDVLAKAATKKKNQNMHCMYENANAYIHIRVQMPRALYKPLVHGSMCIQHFYVLPFFPFIYYAFKYYDNNYSPRNHNSSSALILFLLVFFIVASNISHFLFSCAGKFYSHSHPPRSTENNAIVSFLFQF